MATPIDFKKQYEQLKKQITDIRIAETIMQEANDSFHLGALRKRFEVAYKYLAVADYAKAKSTTVLGQDAGHIYHFAGHHFRFVENWKDAASAYLEGGKCSVVKKDKASIEWAIRCFARAKVCFQDVGDSVEASGAYLCEQEAKRLLYKIENNRVQFFWFTLRKLTTNYGESTYQWIKSFCSIIFLFALFYSVLQCFIPWPDKFSAFSFLNNMYIYITVTLGFGEIIQEVPWQAKMVILLNLITGYTMLALGIDILIRKFKES